MTDVLKTPLPSLLLCPSRGSASHQRSVPARWYLRATTQQVQTTSSEIKTPQRSAKAWTIKEAGESISRQACAASSWMRSLIDIAQVLVIAPSYGEFALDACPLRHRLYDAQAFLTRARHCSPFRMMNWRVGQSASSRRRGSDSRQSQAGPTSRSTQNSADGSLLLQTKVLFGLQHRR